jgi:2-polyprenyl-3-methyl-5-hydroxy-6-metoxy-1,4-benzoquinol methylase
MPSNSPLSSCLLCASTDVRDVTVNRSFGINIFQCKACHFVQSEYVSGRGLESYYRNFYRGRLDDAGLSAHQQKGTAQAQGQIAYLLEQQPGLKISTALDYGTAEGSLGHELCAIADKVWVTEMDPQFVDLLKKDPRLTLVDHQELASDRFECFFDVACISHVLEHLTDPYEAMDLFASALKPGGLLLVDIPNEVRMLQRGFQAKGHLSYFTKDSFTRFVEVHGCFDMMEIRTCNREVDVFINSGFRAPEEYSIPLAKDGTTIRALLRNRPAAARQRRRSHAFDQAALLNEYSARILHFYMTLSATQGRVVQLEQELAQAKQAIQPKQVVSGHSILVPNLIPA